MLCEHGQSLILVVLVMPVFFAISLLVVDGSQGFAQREQVQSAADAAALAAAADVEPALDPGCGASQSCFTSTQADVATTAAKYAAMNGLAPQPPALPPCGAGQTTNCYTWPYPSDGGPGSLSRGRVEVRLQSTVSGFFSGVAGVASDLLRPAARAVAAATGVTTPHCVYEPPIADPDSHLPNCDDIPGTYVPGNGGVGFAKSTSCVFDPDKSAISYTGAGGGSIGALETNGGFTAQGSAGTKTISSLSLGRNGETQANKACYDDPAGVAIIQNPPVGGPFAPKDWPTPLPPIPTPGNGCTDLGSASLTFPVTGHPPGVYCVTGTTATLTLSALDLSAGYTFFAPNIAVQGGTYDCYQLCAGDPAAASNATLFYATGPTGGVTMNGASPRITGNIFAPNGQIAFVGGGVSGGSGFLESQTLKIAGNFASYQGTGGSGGHVEGGSDGQRVDAITGVSIGMDQ